jgi:hypothetical protein
MYTVTSGVTVPKYCRGTFLNNRELSTILGSPFVKLIRHSFVHLLFTTNKLLSTLSPINGAVTTAKLDTSKPHWNAIMSHLRCRPLMLLSTPVSKQSKHREAASAVTCTYHHIKISGNPRPSCARRYLFRYISRVRYDVILQTMYCDITVHYCIFGDTLIRQIQIWPPPRVTKIQGLSAFPHCLTL